MNSAADLYGIRLKMEEKRKRIEAEKRQMELMASRQREKVGKAAFLQVKFSTKKKLISIPEFRNFFKNCVWLAPVNSA